MLTWLMSYKMKPMKTSAILLFASIALIANAEPARTDNALETTGAQPAKLPPAFSQGVKPNEIKKANVTYSGVAVQVVKTRNPLQLINPAAPARYGSAEDNTLRDPVTGLASGWKIFSIRF